MSLITDVFNHVKNVFNIYFKDIYCQNISCCLREIFKITVVNALNLIMQLVKKLILVLSLVNC